MSKTAKATVAKLNIKNRSLFIRDNVDILDNLNSESVDLIYLDPPFNSNKTYSAPIGSKAAGASFKDAWTLSDIDLAWIGQISEKHPALAAVIDAAGMAGGKGDKSYLAFMARRLLELHRILKSTGSLYLHCDPRMSHSLKLVMDCIFGKNNFLNEIVWSYVTGGASRRFFAKKHDVILFYSKTNAYRFYANSVRIPRTVEVLRRMDTGVPSATRAKDRTKLPVDIWADIGALNAMSKERTGYPTQKPLALLERIVKASSHEGDIILDPFCGCATAMVAAEKLGRQWIGVDISDTAVHLIKGRLEADENLFEFAKRIIVRSDIPARTDNGAIMVNPKEYKHTLYGMQTGDCAGCGRHFPFINLTVDHIQPQTKGGQDTEGNLQLLCGFCNSVKGGRDMAYLLAELKKRGITK